MQSIAIPAVGTGNLKVPPEIVAHLMYDEVEMFSKNFPATSLKDIRFVIYDKDHVTLSVSVDFIFS